MSINNGKVIVTSSDTAHVFVENPDVAFFPDGEREVALCGASVQTRSGLDLNGHRLADMDDRGWLCGDCFEKLQNADATIPGFMSDGERLSVP